VAATDTVSRPAVERLFGARSIALVGASERSNYARNLVTNIRECGFDGDVYLVHPRETEQFGLPCLPSLLDVPGPVDVAWVLTGPGSFLSILADCGRKNVAWAAVLSGGFKEIGDKGAELESSLAETARANGVHVLGPNALGFLSSPNKLGAFGSPLTRPLIPGALGLVSQSGQLATQLHRRAVTRSIGMSHVAAVGNCAMISAVDLLDFMVDDPETRVLTALLETLEPADRFAEVATRALEAGKPLVVLKIGRTERTRRVAVAHTGVLAGEDRVIDGVLRQLGVIRVDRPEELLEVGGLLASKGWPKGAGTAVLTGSGGASGVISDLVEGTLVDLVQPSPDTTAALAEIVEGFGVAQNPMDLTGFLGDPKVYGTTAALLAADPVYDTVITVVDPPLEDTPGGHRRVEAAVGVDESVAAAGKFTFVAVPVAGPIQGIGALAVTDCGVWYSNGLGAGIHALDKAIGYAAARDRVLGAAEDPRALPRLAPGSLDRTGALTETESLRLLEAAGVRSPRSELATSAEDAGDRADAIGYPVVLKISSPDVAHKTEAGGVLLGVTTREQAETGYRTIVDRVGERQPGARIDGVLVVEQIAPVVELLVGIVHDPQFGAVVSLGAGGTLTELLDDVAIRRPPLTTADVDDMLAQLRVSALLEGYRGSPPGDREALVEAVKSIGDLALVAAGGIRELDVNPLFVLPRRKGVVAGDALAVLS
jgi:acyl-CoA synthetase (NDP forming)